MKRAERNAQRDAQVEASKEIYKIAQERANIEIAELKGEMKARQEEGVALGFLGANKVHRAFCDFADALMLYKMKKTKDYKKEGLTWEQFCETAGYARRTAEDIIADIAPVVGAFSANLAAFSGIGLNDIRYLGKAKPANFAGFTEDGLLKIGEDTIPATPEDITAYIRHTREQHKAETDDLQATIVARDKVLADKEAKINKYAEDLAMAEGKAKALDLTLEEEGFLKKIKFLRTGFDGYLLQLDPDRISRFMEANDKEPTPRMRAAYLAALDYMKKQILVAFERATDMYGNAIMCPEAAWKPGMGAALTVVEKELEVDSSASDS